MKLDPQIVQQLIPLLKAANVKFEEIFNGNWIPQINTLKADFAARGNTGAAQMLTELSNSLNNLRIIKNIAIFIFNQWGMAPPNQDNNIINDATKFLTAWKVFQTNGRVIARLLINDQSSQKPEDRQGRKDYRRLNRLARRTAEGLNAALESFDIGRFAEYYYNCIQDARSPQQSSQPVSEDYSPNVPQINLSSKLDKLKKISKSFEIELKKIPKDHQL